LARRNADTEVSDTAVNRTLSRLSNRAQLALILGIGHAAGWAARGEKPRVDREAVLETWRAVSDGAHNSNTDLIHWDGAFYLIHQTSPYHPGSSRSRLLLWRSPDARAWEKVAEFKAPRGEYRDPKFAAIGDRLFIYALPNYTFLAEPATTVFTYSTDARTWTPMEETDHPGWLFWRPKTRDQKTWYVTAYWNEHGKSILLKSTDGITWKTVSTVYEGERNDETDFEFLPDGRILATARLEVDGGWRGHPRGGALLAVSKPPYRKWNYARSTVTRLDGPCLFPYNGRVYAAGRYQASFAPFARQGGILAKKRTSLFLVEEARLVRLTDLPSAGDTSYAGVVIQGDDLYVSYYTSRIKQDPTWVVGMFSPSDIRIARISLPALERLALRKASPGV